MKAWSRLRQNLEFGYYDCVLYKVVNSAKTVDRVATHQDVIADRELPMFLLLDVLLSGMQSL